MTAAGFKAGQGAKARGIGWDEECSPTLAAEAGGNCVPSVCIKVFDARGNGDGDTVGTMASTVLTQPEQAKANGGFSANCNQIIRTRYIVRRLTPTECARLQGFPDDWGHPDIKDDLSDEECAFWQEARNTHAAINGKAAKSYTKAQMLTWYNKLHTDGAEYKMWGNGIALPTALYVMQGIADALEAEVDYG